jgi:hypothetical protein
MEQVHLNCTFSSKWLNVSKTSNVEQIHAYFEIIYPGLGALSKGNSTVSNLMEKPVNSFISS